LGEGLTARVVSFRRNGVVGRLEYELEVLHVGRGTPSLFEVRRRLAEKLGVQLDRVYVRKLLTEYGVGVSKARVHVYDDPEKAKEFEPSYVLRRNDESRRKGK